MKGLVFSSIAASLLAASALAQEPVPGSTDYFSGQFDLGLFQKDVDTTSSKFLEYRDIPNGIAAPFFRLNGDKAGWRFDLAGQFLQQTDQRYRLRAEKGAFQIEGDYNTIPHRFGNGGRSLEQDVDDGVFRIAPGLQQQFQTAIGPPNPAINYTFLNNLVTPSLNASPADIDLVLDRERSNLATSYNPGTVGVTLAYFRERRTGDRAAAGTSYGFNNVVENPEPVGYLTQDLGADAEYAGTWGVARAGVHYNWFRNNIPTLSFDNPFRAVDSVGSGPSSSNTGGPVRGLVSLPPDNEAFTGTAAAMFKVGKKSRAGADFAIGRWSQDTTNFIPYSTNTAITSPLNASNPASLPAQRLEGKIDTTSFNAYFNSRPQDRLSVNLRFRHYDLDNQTPQISFPGYARFDSEWVGTARISVPYGYTNDRLDATVSFDVGDATLEGGYRWTTRDRTFRETESTTENALLLNANYRPNDWLLVRAGFERGDRDYDGLEIERSEHASFVNASTPTNLLAIPSNDPAFTTTYNSFGCGAAPCNIRFDQAARKSDRWNAQLQASPGSGKTTFGLSWNYSKDDYDETNYGLLLTKYNTVTAEVDYTPGTKWSVYGFYTWEKINDDQQGRQSGSSVSTNPLDDWSSTVEDSGSTFGAGANLTFVPDKWTGSLFGRWQKIDGNNDFTIAQGGAPAGSRPNGAIDIPGYDDTEILGINVELKHQFHKSWSCILGGWFEDYDVEDAQTTGSINYAPGSFFLAANDGDFQAWWAYLKLSYRW